VSAKGPHWIVSVEGGVGGVGRVGGIWPWRKGRKERKRGKDKSMRDIERRRKIVETF